MNIEIIEELKSFAEYYESNGQYKKADEIDELIRTAASKPWYKNPATYLSALGLMAAPTIIKDINTQSPATGLPYSTTESFDADVDKFNRIKEKDNQQKEFEYSAQQVKDKPQQTKPTPKPKIQKGDFNLAINKMLNLEGGKTYEKSDKGGKTNFGITQRTFNTWRDSINKPRTDVYKISQEEAKEIYKKNYWDLIKGSQLPHDIAQAIMSMALTDGPQDAIRHTQKILGIPPTGIMGPITMKSIWSAAKQKGTKKLTNYIVDKQIQRYQADEQAKTYGRGWTNRAESLRPK
jgi:hypothetical protein